MDSTVDSGSTSPGCFFFFLVDLSPGEAVSGMQIEIDTGHSYFMTAARRRRGRFLDLLASLDFKLSVSERVIHLFQIFR